MAKSLHLQIVTPQHIVFEGDVDNFTAPGAVGPFQVLHNHAPIVSALVPGLFKYEVDGREERFAISGGFLELHENKANVLATAAERASEIDITRAEKAKARAQERSRIHDGSVDQDRVHAALERANARISVVRPTKG